MSPVRIIATKRRALSAHALVRPAVPIRASHRQRITSLAAAMRVQHPHVRLSTTGYSPANDLKVLFSFHLCCAGVQGRDYSRHDHRNRQLRFHPRCPSRSSFHSTACYRILTAYG